MELVARTTLNHVGQLGRTANQVRRNLAVGMVHRGFELGCTGRKLEDDRVVERGAQDVPQAEAVVGEEDLYGLFLAGLLVGQVEDVRDERLLHGIGIPRRRR